MIKFDEIITKEVFEAAVPAAKTPDRNDSIFNRISSGFGEAAVHLEQFAESEEIIERVYNSFAGIYHQGTLPGSDSYRHRIRNSFLLVGCTGKRCKG